MKFLPTHPNRSRGCAGLSLSVQDRESRGFIPYTGTSILSQTNTAYTTHTTMGRTPHTTRFYQIDECRSMKILPLRHRHDDSLC